MNEVGPRDEEGPRERKGPRERRGTNMNTQKQKRLNQNKLMDKKVSLANIDFGPGGPTIGRV